MQQGLTSVTLPPSDEQHEKQESLRSAERVSLSQRCRQSEACTASRYHSPLRSSLRTA